MFSNSFSSDFFAIFAIMYIMAIAIIMAIIAIKVIIQGITKTWLSHEQDLPNKLGQAFVIQTYFTAIARHQAETRGASDLDTV